MEEFSCICLIVLNGINVSPLTNALTCLPVSSGGSVVDYVLTKACKLSMVNAFKISPLSHDSYYISPCTCTYTLTLFRVKEERKYII